MKTVRYECYSPSPRYPNRRVSSIQQAQVGKAHGIQVCSGLKVAFGRLHQRDPSETRIRSEIWKSNGMELCWSHLLSLSAMSLFSPLTWEMSKSTHDFEAKIESFSRK